jgi:hypothetical protein
VIFLLKELVTSVIVFLAVTLDVRTLAPLDIEKKSKVFLYTPAAVFNNSDLTEEKTRILKVEDFWTSLLDCVIQ